ASDGAVVLDDGVAHQHYFLVAGLEGDTRVPIIIPRQSRQISATIAAAGTEQIQVAGRQVSARRFTIEPAGMPARTLWVDAQNRVLRLRIPDDDY
ncbi:MAG: hypothetical protein GWM90_27090, partial [Gemmatimonadetes bacterium]|nr:hypothetical protein [Gemmatimonadota bacterium]NIQ58597.1 hypothetical protein [Gemmatimonadota bacterium]NIU78787.1 hypothetical protein [Gammaproteobacteria bacterium]NIX47600.1 hypothetical protein [Gemmatimonadota bacterium]NIY11959.1 hypothetical protein [Gemmatimonadota bacterium]